MGEQIGHALEREALSNDSRRVLWECKWAERPGEKHFPTIIAESHWESKWAVRLGKKHFPTIIAESHGKANGPRAQARSIFQRLPQSPIEEQIGRAPRLELYSNAYRRVP